MSLAAAQECSFCEQGFYAKADQTGCDACPAGHYGSPDENLRDKNTTGCLPCRAGSYSRALGIDTADKCVACPPGKHGTLAASISEAACKECDVGRYSNNTGLTSCLPCPPGTATDGTINLGRGQTRCSTCPAGTEVNALKTLCVKVCISKNALSYYRCKTHVFWSLCVQLDSAPRGCKVLPLRLVRTVSEDGLRKCPPSLSHLNLALWCSSNAMLLQQSRPNRV